ncbi:SCO1860 family LAETG-anchored protein [Streptomyces aureus]|uniref:SCO1860 family LAETG-anchored protein n=1 Tax=Streptomyces aureus TaxID=193461 RepID=UPI000559D34B|nr:SCO1860 family LAETG-anchored protein [Streptomyces aureus]
MNSYTHRTPARRLAVTAAATVLAAGPTALAGAGTAHASDDHGRASAVVLRTGLDVSLLKKTVDVPLAVSLNEVQAPQSADKTALTAQLDGVDRGRPFSVLRADVAHAEATVSAAKAEGSTHLAHAVVHVPGLPLLSLIEVEQVTSKATCEAGKQPVATANLLGSVTVLGKKVTVTTGGPTHVKVPGVGEVRLDLSKTETTSRTAAASALELNVSVDPLKLGVAAVEGTVTLAKSTCESPAAPAAEESASPAPSKEADAPVAEASPQGGQEEETGGLAETGGSSMTPYLAGGAAVLLAAGAGAVTLSRRRRS